MGGNGFEVVINGFAEILFKVKHPTRYIGNEINSTLKSTEPLFLLCYPDVYEIGMSNLGIQILRHILASEGYNSERVFSPDRDLERELTLRDLPLFSLESKTPVKNFPVLGFSLECELNITNMINVLTLGKIPLSRLERDDDDPVVIAGGASVLNPEPWSFFIDAFVEGEAEFVILKIALLAEEYKKKRITRHEFLKELSLLQGVYVPEFPCEIVEYLRVDELLFEHAPLPPIVPFMKTTHDRQAVEISRGCPRSCKFCQAGSVSRNVRHRPAKDVIEIAKAGIEMSGWEELSLLSLSVCDHPELDLMVADLYPYLKRNRTNLSLPSLRADSVSEHVLKIAGDLGHRTLTLAPEAGNESLRTSIGKTMKDQDILTSVERAVKYGFERIKFYFMVGLPGEKDRDLEDIADLVLDVSKAMKKKDIRVSIAPFVPRPHTLFQNAPQESYEEITRKYCLIANKLQKMRRNINFRDPKVSFVEGLLSRGAENISAAAIYAFNSGSRFDQWHENFNFELWKDSLERAGVDIHGESKNPSYIQKRWERIKVRHTPSKPHTRVYEKLSFTPPSSGFVLSNPGKVFYYRLKYSKEEPLRHISHLELTNAVLRSLRRAGLKLDYTRGKRPKPDVSFGPPLPCGATSDAELMDFSSQFFLETSIIESLKSFFPKGIKPLELFYFDKKPPPITSSDLEITYICENCEIDETAKKRFYSDECCSVERIHRGRTKKIELKKYVKNIDTGREGFVFKINFTREGSVRLSELESYFHIKKFSNWKRTVINQR
ncbi:DUF2344 domain-containing protein [candidate division WOR-3 bacterium]|nr:DUF2344 domain-containing protein [candidate division WOR-3 bacterium]